MAFPITLHLRRLHWHVVVLLLSIALTGAAAFEAQRAVRSERRIAERALRDYASFAAWSYAQHLSFALDRIQREAIGSVNHGDETHTAPHVPTALDLAQYLPLNERCDCHRSRVGPTPRSFFAIDLRSGLLDPGEMRHDGAASEGSASGTTNPPAERRWLLDSLVRRVRSQSVVDRGFTFVVDRTPGWDRIFAYTLMPTAWGDTLVYGARYSVADLAEVLAATLDENGLLPATFIAGRRNRDVLAVAVHDGAGHPVWVSDSTTHDFALGASVGLSPREGNLQIDAVLRPQMAGLMLIGGLPGSRLPFLLGLLALAAALSLVSAAQFRREGQLAQLRSGFVSSVSHELRTPVAQIRLYIDTLRLGRVATDAQREWALGHIDRETRRLTHLVENVLRFSTLGADEPPARTVVDASAEIETIIDELRPLARSRETLIELDAASGTPVRVRPDALRHIVINLLDTAMKYGPRGQLVTVTVRRDDRSALISVEDEGPGVAATERESIWRAFTRGAAAADTGGSGIGLTIARDVADGNGGSVGVETGTRGGARFVVTLPLADTELAT